VVSCVRLCSVSWSIKSDTSGISVEVVLEDTVRAHLEIVVGPGGGDDWRRVDGCEVVAPPREHPKRFAAWSKPRSPWE
jgi:hypothetical protein